MTDFSTVDAGDASTLVAMMDATDAWPAVRTAREWVLEEAGVGDGSVVVDAGCGPGTFGGLAARRNATTIDVDCSLSMLRAVGARAHDAQVVCADASALPVRARSAALVRGERVLQWMPDPRSAVRELHRVVAPGGWLATTDTDWATLTLEPSDSCAHPRWRTAALAWVPNARVARELPDVVQGLGVTDLRSRVDTVEITAWDPDHPAQHDGPPGLPLRSIAAHGDPADEAALTRDFHALGDEARAGRFCARLTLVTVLGRTPQAERRPG